MLAPWRAALGQIFFAPPDLGSPDIGIVPAPSSKMLVLAKRVAKNRGELYGFVGYPMSSSRGVALGLTAYTVEDMNSLVNLLADYIELDFEREEGVVYEKAKRLSRLVADLNLGMS